MQAPMLDLDLTHRLDRSEMIHPVNLLLLPPSFGDILHHLLTRLRVFAKRFLDDQPGGERLGVGLVMRVRLVVLGEHLREGGELRWRDGELWGDFTVKVRE